MTASRLSSIITEPSTTNFKNIMRSDKPHIVIMGGRWVVLGKMKIDPQIRAFVKRLNVSQGRIS